MKEFSVMDRVMWNHTFTSPLDRLRGRVVGLQEGNPLHPRIKWDGQEEMSPHQDVIKGYTERDWEDWTNNIDIVEHHDTLVDLWFEKLKRAALADSK